MNSFRSILANRSFQAIWAASIVSGLGDRIAVIALYLLVYRFTGRAVDLGLLAAVQILPAILLGPLVGTILDRASRKAVMVWSDLASAVVVALLPLTHSLGQVYLLAGLLAAGRQFSGPARLAVIPDVVPDGELDKANSLAMLSRNVVLLVGPALGGALVAVWGTDSAFWVDSGTFVASAVLLASRSFTYLKLGAAVVQRPVDLVTPLAVRAWRGIFQGAALVWHSARLRFAFLFFGATVLVTAMQTPLVVLFIKEVLGRGDMDLGLVLSASGLGGIAGALAGSLLLSGRRPLRTVSWLMMGYGCLLVLFALAQHIVATLVIFCLFGIISTIAQISLASFLQREAPAEHRGKVFGWLGAFIQPLSLASVFIGSLAADAVGVVLVLIFSGSFELLVGVMGLTLLPRLRPVEALTGQGADRAGLGDGAAAGSAGPVAQIEKAAGHAARAGGEKMAERA